MNHSIALETTQPSKVLNIALWIAQFALSGLFLMAGFMKLTQPIEVLSATVAWAADMPGLVRFIGLSELLGGIGLLLPAFLRIKPVLTPLAAVGIAIIMVLAMGYHGMRGEFGSVIFNLFLFGVAVFVAWGRFKKAPIAPRM